MTRLQKIQVIAAAFLSHQQTGATLPTFGEAWKVNDNFTDHVESEYSEYPDSDKISSIEGFLDVQEDDLLDTMYSEVA